MIEIVENMSNYQIQMTVLSIWAVLTMYLINRGGRNNEIFIIVVQSGYRLILLGAITAAIITNFKDPSFPSFTEATMNFVLILSAAVGASYIAHANMSLRDNPNVSAEAKTLAEDFNKKNKK